MALHPTRSDKGCDLLHAQLAECITAPGVIHKGNVSAVATSTSVTGHPLTISGGREHLQAIVDPLADYGRNVRKLIVMSYKTGDACTADLPTGLLRAVDKHLWLVEAHLQADS